MATLPEGIPLRAGVAGAGVFGGIHAQKFEASKDTVLSAVFDPDAPRASVLAERYGADAYATYDDFLTNVDVVTVAAPAADHFELGLKALRAGKHVYMEKPMALCVSDAETLANEARAADVVVQVGHQERLVVDATGLFTDGVVPDRLEFARCGPSSGRCEDVSVVWDLMIHDLDLAARVGMGALLDAHVVGDEHETVATLSFTGDRTASFIASRRCPERHRTMTAIYPDGEVTLDFIDRKIGSTRPSVLLRDAALAHALSDPLGAHVQGFLDAVKGRVQISSGDARVAVKYAEAVEAARLKTDSEQLETTERVAQKLSA